MIHIEFHDYDPLEMFLNSLAGWVVRVDDEVDVFVTGCGSDERGFAQLVGNECDDEGNPLNPKVERRFAADDITIDVY